MNLIIALALLVAGSALLLFLGGALVRAVGIFFGAGKGWGLGERFALFMTSKAFERGVEALRRGEEERAVRYLLEGFRYERLGTSELVCRRVFGFLSEGVTGVARARRRPVPLLQELDELLAERIALHRQYTNAQQALGSFNSKRGRDRAWAKGEFEARLAAAKLELQSNREELAVIVRRVCSEVLAQEQSAERIIH